MKMVPLGDILQEYKLNPLQNEDLPVLTLTEKNGFVYQKDRFNKRLATEDTSTYKVVRPMSLAFNPYLLWAGALAQNTGDEAGIISPLYPTFNVKDTYDPAYIYRLLLTPEMIQRYDSIAYGSVPRRRRSSVKDFLSLQIPMPPPLDEQRRIAAILDKAETIRQKRRQAIAHLDTLTESLFHATFGEPDVWVSRWEQSTVGDLTTQVTDGAHHTPKRQSDGYPLLSARNIRNGWINFAESDFVGQEEYERLRKRVDPRQGDILISCSGTIGRVAVVPSDIKFTMVRSVALIRPSSVALSSFLATLLSTYTLQRKMLREAKSSAQANLFQNQIRQLPAFTPPMSLQKQFANCAWGISKQKEKFDEQLRNANELFKSLQSRAFRGEL